MTAFAIICVLIICVFAGFGVMNQNACEKLGGVYIRAMTKMECVEAKEIKLP